MSSLIDPSDQIDVTENTPARPIVFTVTETAEKLRISRNSAYEAVRNGTIPSIRIGRRRLIPASWLDSL